jgi:hypothetical protein
LTIDGRQVAGGNGGDRAERRHVRAKQLDEASSAARGVGTI